MHACDGQMILATGLRFEQQSRYMLKSDLKKKTKNLYCSQPPITYNTLSYLIWETCFILTPLPSIIENRAICRAVTTLCKIYHILIALFRLGLLAFATLLPL